MLRTVLRRGERPRECGPRVGMVGKARSLRSGSVVITERVGWNIKVATIFLDPMEDRSTAGRCTENKEVTPQFFGYVIAISLR